MSDNSIRTGKISSVNYEQGTVRVFYPDTGNVTVEIPVLNFNGEYKMPKIDDMVLVTHLSNGSALGIVGGTFWSPGNIPPETGANIYRKDLAQNVGEAYIKYDSNTKTVTIKAEKIILESTNVKTNTVNLNTLNADVVNSPVINS